MDSKDSQPKPVQQPPETEQANGTAEGNGKDETYTTGRRAANIILTHNVPLRLICFAALDANNRLLTDFDAFGGQGAFSDFFGLARALTRALEKWENTVEAQQERLSAVPPATLENILKSKRR